MKRHDAWLPELEAIDTVYLVVEPDEREREAEVAYARCADLASAPDILRHFADVLTASGFAGNTHSAQLVYLMLTSRFLARPVSGVVKGPSAGGKSWVIERTLDYFPDDAYFELNAMSERALIHDDRPLRHRFIVDFEAAGLSGDFASYLMRSLLSEGRLSYVTVEKTSEGLRPRTIEREGPTGLLVTTTAVLHALASGSRREPNRDT